ncbi:hypothetical protein ALC57_07081 [Trachymyrmex cornetzi]|uniref:Uncharacterized protein n=1 Tax=Trachymyrmex cornetzi TaxID=471704 RepID=A0A195E6U6_9HYME|nr:hypothetical protein ALC57_07081 [Trachymyrmex cornetzi]
MHSAEIETAPATLETSERLVSRHYERSPGAQRLSREWFRVETLETSELMSRCYVLEAIPKVDEATFIGAGFTSSNPGLYRGTRYERDYSHCGPINILDDTADMFRVVNGDLGLSDINYACGLLPRLNPPYIKLGLSDRSFDARIVLTLCRLSSMRQMTPKISKKLSLEALELLFYPDESENPFDMHDSDFDFEDSNDLDSDCD